MENHIPIFEMSAKKEDGRTGTDGKFPGFWEVATGTSSTSSDSSSPFAGGRHPPGLRGRPPFWGVRRRCVLPGKPSAPHHGPEEIGAPCHAASRDAPRPPRQPEPIDPWGETIPENVPVPPT